VYVAGFKCREFQRIDSVETGCTGYDGFRHCGLFDAGRGSPDGSRQSILACSGSQAMTHEIGSLVTTAQPSSLGAADEPRAHTASTDRIIRSSGAGTHPIVFFDGVCGLCNRFVDFLLPRDRKHVFLLAPLQGETARARLSAEDVENVSTIVLLDEVGTHRRSKAVVRILCRLGWGWKVAGFLLAMIPRPLRDLGYKLVARYRYVWFGKKETCRMPTPDERARFLP
jgi:predicted DCC family thiol-disulfide oxidoreductase YuxK